MKEDSTDTQGAELLAWEPEREQGPHPNPQISTS